MPAPRGDREGEAARARATPASNEPPGASGITLDREARKIIVVRAKPPRRDPTPARRARPRAPSDERAPLRLSARSRNRSHSDLLPLSPFPSPQRDVIRVMDKLASNHVTAVVREARATVAAAAHEGALRRLARARDDARAGVKVASPYASVVAAARGESRASREDFARAAAEHIAALADRELEHARAVRVAAEREERGSPEEGGSPAPGSGARQPTLDGVVAALFAAGSAEAERAEAEEAAAGGGGAARAPGRGGAEAAPALGPGARAADLAARGRDGGEATNAAATSRGAGDAAAGGAGAGAPPDAAPRVRTPRASRSAPRAVTRGRG